jgi:hypothetical protein
VAADAISPTSPGGTSPAVVDQAHLHALDGRADRARLALASGWLNEAIGEVSDRP